MVPRQKGTAPPIRHMLRLQSKVQAAPLGSKVLLGRLQAASAPEARIKGFARPLAGSERTGSALRIKTRLRPVLWT